MKSCQQIPILRAEAIEPIFSVPFFHASSVPSLMQRPFLRLTSSLAAFAQQSEYCTIISSRLATPLN